MTEGRKTLGDEDSAWPANVTTGSSEAAEEPGELPYGGDSTPKEGEFNSGFFSESKAIPAICGNPEGRCPRQPPTQACPRGERCRRPKLWPEHVNWAAWSTQCSLVLVLQKQFILYGLRIWFLNSPLFPTKPHWRTCTAGLGQHIFYTNSQIAWGMQLQTIGLHFIHPCYFSILQLRCPFIFMQRYRFPSSGTENKIQLPKLVTRSLTHTTQSPGRKRPKQALSLLVPGEINLLSCEMSQH